MLKKDDWELTLSELNNQKNQLEIQAALNKAAIKGVVEMIKKFKDEKPKNSTDKIQPIL